MIFLPFQHEITYSIISSFIFQSSGLLHIDMNLSLFFCVFIINLLKRVLSPICCVIVSVTIIFFVSFHVDSSNNKIRSEDLES